MQRRVPSILALALVLQGCPAAAPTGTMPGTASGGMLSPGGPGMGRPAGTSAPAPAASAAPGASAPGASAPRPGKADTSGIGLGTFFDSYNFNFPIPPGQALGAVTNLSQGALPPAGGRVYLQVGLQTTDQLPAARRPLNVSFVFDHSGSMAGDKIAYSRLAAGRMVEALGEQDTFSLVTFDSEATTLIPPGFAVDKADMKARIATIQENSGTNIDRGLALGYEHVQARYDQGKINRVILMSDGEATEGDTSAESLGMRAADFARRDISLTTIGVGLGFNEGFMTHLATRGAGSFYFVGAEADVDQAFSGEIKALQRVVARGVKLKIDLAAGVKLVKVYGHTSSTEGQSLSVDSNDLIASQSKVLLLELEVPAGAAGTDFAVGSVAADFEDVTFGGKKTATAAAKVTYTADAAAQAASRDARVASSVINLQTAAVMIAAAQGLDVGDWAYAGQLLRDQHTLVATKADELGDADLRDLAASLRGYVQQVEAQADPAALTKALQNEAFQIQQGKKKAVASPSPSPAPAASQAPAASPSAAA